MRGKYEKIRQEIYRKEYKTRFAELISKRNILRTELADLENSLSGVLAKLKRRSIDFRVPDFSDSAKCEPAVVSNIVRCKDDIIRNQVRENYNVIEAELISSIEHLRNMIDFKSKVYRSAMKVLMLNQDKEESDFTEEQFNAMTKMILLSSPFSLQTKHANISDLDVIQSIGKAFKNANN